MFVYIFSVMLFTYAAGQGSLASGFIKPPASAKARTWWHWINGNVSKEGITADLEAMKRVGIQEAQIFNVDQGYPEGPASFMSNSWLDAFQFAVSEAKRLGLEIGFHNGAGWSSSGGPWVTPEYGMQTLVFSEAHYNGKKRIKEVLPHPKVNLGYYKDIAVIAFPTPEGSERVDDLAAKSLSGDGFKNHLYPDKKNIRQSSVINKKDIINLTNKMFADGTLNWSVPDGDWTILRIGHTPNGTKNRPAGVGGLGLECDKLSRRAVDVYWAGGIQPIIDRLGPLVGSSLTNCLIDSYEVGCGNWTSGFEKEFKKYRGYDCIAFLPALAGYYVESGEITERFLWDFRKTIGDLMAENYYHYFSERCHEHGMKFSVEPYGGPFNAMQAGLKGDVIMGEFWMGNTVYQNTLKLASSIAHLNGQSVVGAESFTSMGGWKSHPATLKQRGDWVWSEGVNRFIFHTYVHQPWNIAPGITFHMYGVEMSRLNTWWEQGRAYMDYIARSQYLLQQGRNVADALIFTGEASPNDGILRQDIKELGYDYDEIGVKQMLALSVKNNVICTKAGGKYRLLILPEIDWMTPELLSKIKELLENGATVVATKPDKSPGLTNFPACDEQVKTLARELWDTYCVNNGALGKGKIVSKQSIKDVLKEVELPPDFSGGPDGADLHFIHRINDSADIYFLANPVKEHRALTCYFRVTGKQPEFWNAETGRIQDAAVWKEEENGTTAVPIDLDPEGSVFVVFRKTASNPHIIQTKTFIKQQTVQPLNGLKIIKAGYGIFLPDELMDVTEILNSHIKNGKLNIVANNALVSKDPAPGTVKELRILYEVNGKQRVISAEENVPLLLQDEGRIVRALYGKFTDNEKGVPQPSVVHDVTEKVKKLVASDSLTIYANNYLTGDAATASASGNELRLEYMTEGEVYHSKVAQGTKIDFILKQPEPRLKKEKNRLIWETPYPGKLDYLTSSGAKKSIEVPVVKYPIELKGKWDVSFPPDRGAPAKATFDTLSSWSLSNIEGIRYFSGTATYYKSFTLPKELLGKDYALELDLGSVKVIAEVFVNSKPMGILWKPPFRVDISNAVFAGVNKLEVRITNLWPNRLIGDEQQPQDVDWGEWTVKRWPEWLINNTQRPSKRITFTTWKHWNKDALLQSSGLLGPVYIRPYKRFLLSKL